jgi:hypothetical protein
MGILLALPAERCKPRAAWQGSCFNDLVELARSGAAKFAAQRQKCPPGNEKAPPEGMGEARGFLPKRKT